MHSHTTEEAGEHYHATEFEYNDELRRIIGSLTNYRPLNYDGIEGTCGPDNKYECKSWNSSSTGLHEHGLATTGGGAQIDNRPQFYALAFLMKI